MIVPVVDEEEQLPACLASVGPSSVEHEVLVVDGGSRDASPEVARSMGARVVKAPRGRAVQQNRGAARAAGDVLLFLHADVRLPSDGLQDVARALAAPEVVGGGFLKRYEPPGPVMDASAWLQNHVRTRFGRSFVGTNAMFVRRRVFEELGGFTQVPLLEDVILSDRMRAAGPVAVVPSRVTVSARKYRRDGPLARMARNVWIMIQYRLLGRSPEELVEQYR